MLRGDKGPTEGWVPCAVYRLLTSHKRKKKLVVTVSSRKWGGGKRLNTRKYIQGNPCPVEPRLFCPEIFCLSLALVISWQYCLLQIVILQQRGSSQPRARIRLPGRKYLTLQSCYWCPSASLILISVIDSQASPLQGSNINIPKVYSLFSV